MVDVLQWFGATFAVLALVLLLAHGLKRFMERARPSHGPIQQVGSWRVAPDASVRAVRVLDRVHVLYERGRESVVLESLEATRVAELRTTEAVEGPLDLLRRARRRPAPKARVAKG